MNVWIGGRQGEAKMEVDGCREGREDRMQKKSRDIYIYILSPVESVCGGGGGGGWWIKWSKTKKVEERG